MAEITPGAPPSASTHSPESSASAGSPVRRAAWRALASAFSMKVPCGSAASGTLNCCCDSTSMPSGRSSWPISSSLCALPVAMTIRCMSPSQGGFLLLHQRADAVLCQLQHGVHLVAAERCAFRRALHFDETAAAGHHHIHVGVAAGVLDIVQIQHRLALVHADRNGGDEIGERGCCDQLFLQQGGD